MTPITRMRYRPANPGKPLRLAVLLAVGMLAAMTVAAQDVAAPVDQPYSGVIELKVDVTNLDQKIFRVQEHIPVKPGKMTLLYPQWLPGNHAPTGPLAQFNGLKLTAGRHALDWRRDTVNMYAFHVDVPAGVDAIDAEFEFTSPVESNQGRIVATPDMVGLQWNTVLLYPAGYFSHGIAVAPSLTLPAAWQFGTALELKEQVGAEARFKTVALDELVDSPVFAGRNFRRIDLDPGAKTPVFLNVVADRAEYLDAKPEQIALHRALVQQAYRLYGSHHYDHYDFLLGLSDDFSRIGLEHHQSSENAVKPAYFTEWDKSVPAHALLPHEYTHSWNGKFRRPADLWTANFNTPMQDTLLWVYEGQTTYWGYVLATRSGLMSQAQMRDYLANTAAVFSQRSGRTWRALQDTTNQPIISYHAPGAWTSWQRAADYYDEGALIWLDVDTRMREMSGDKRSLNDFARAFFSVEDGSHKPLTYTFEDVVKTLNGVQPYDWAKFLDTRLESHAPEAPLEGLTRAGWKLEFAEQQSDLSKAMEAYRDYTDFSYSLGFVVDKQGRLDNVVWDGPAFKAGLTGGATLLAVNGRTYKAELLKQAIKEAKGGKEPIELILKKDDRYRTVRLDYHDGLRYPILKRIDGVPDRLDAILQPLK